MVVLTAMDVNSLPPALLQYEPIELWLETRLPTPARRAAILTPRLAQLPPPLGAVDIGRITEASAKLTGADLQAEQFICYWGSIFMCIYSFSYIYCPAPRGSHAYCDFGRCIVVAVDNDDLRREIGGDIR